MKTTETIDKSHIGRGTGRERRVRLEFLHRPGDESVRSSDVLRRTATGGQEQLAVVNASVFATNVLVVGQGTSTPMSARISLGPKRVPGIRGMP